MDGNLGGSFVITLSKQEAGFVIISMVLLLTATYWMGFGQALAARSASNSYVGALLAYWDLYFTHRSEALELSNLCSYFGIPIRFTKQDTAATCITAVVGAGWSMLGYALHRFYGVRRSLM